MRIVFIADAHLKGLDDPNQHALCRFLSGIEADRVIILGDLFDFWTGFNDVVYYHYMPVLDALCSIHKRGVELTYIEGNHDFSMGPFFSEVIGVELATDHLELTIDNRRFFLAHGDTVDEDIGYRLWRGFLRSTLYRFLTTRIVHPSLTWKIARLLSRTSRTYNEKGFLINRRLRKFARERIRDGFDVVVLAHSHIAGIEEEEVNGRKGVYVNPGGWMDGWSYLVYEDGFFSLEKFSE